MIVQGPGNSLIVSSLSAPESNNILGANAKSYICIRGANPRIQPVSLLYQKIRYNVTLLKSLTFVSWLLWPKKLFVSGALITGYSVICVFDLAESRIQ